MLYRQLLVLPMTATATAQSMGPDVRSAWARYVAVMSGLMLVVVASLYAVWPWPYEQIVLRVLLPRHEAASGFHGGWIRPVNFEYSAYGIASVVPGGRLERAGVRAGDIPVYGATSLYEALEDVTEGRTGRFSVVSDAGNWLEDRRRPREIRVYPK